MPWAQSRHHQNSTTEELPFVSNLRESRRWFSVDVELLIVGVTSFPQSEHLSGIVGITIASESKWLEFRGEKGLPEMNDDDENRLKNTT